MTVTSKKGNLLCFPSFLNTHILDDCKCQHNISNDGDGPFATCGEGDPAGEDQDHTAHDPKQVTDNDAHCSLQIDKLGRGNFIYKEREGQQSHSNDPKCEW